MKKLHLILTILTLVVSFSAMAQETPEHKRIQRLTSMLAKDNDSVAGVLYNTKSDVLKIFEFVRDQIAFEGYAGALRGAEGTLMARAGNSWDQAILLKTLLDKIDVKCKLVRSRLPEDYYPDLKAMEKQPASGGVFLAPLSKAMELPQAVEKYDRDLKGFTQSLIADARGEQKTIPFEKETKLALPDTTLYGDYLWVQAEIGEKVYDFHPVFPKGTTLVLDSMGVMNSLVSIPEEMSHWVRFRCFIERNSGEGLTRELIFNKKILATTSTLKAFRFSLNPEIEKDGKITLNPTLLKGNIYLSDKSVAVRSSAKGNTIGVLTGAWLEISVLSPAERPRTTSIALADSIADKPLWKERKSLGGGKVLVLPDEELFATVEMGLFTAGLSVQAALSYDLELHRQIQKIKRYQVNELRKPRFANPVLFRWASLLKPLLQSLNSGERAYLDSPAVVAVLYKPVPHREQIHLMSWAGIFHFRSRGGDPILNGVCASLLLEKVAGFKDSLPQASKRGGVSFRSVKDEAAIMPLKETWQRYAWNMLRVDIISGHRCYIPTDNEIQYWWKQEKTCNDPLLKGSAGWLKRWQVVESPQALTRNISSELFFFIDREINDKNEKEVITRAVSRFISTHLSSFSLSAVNYCLPGK